MAGEKPARPGGADAPARPRFLHPRRPRAPGGGRRRPLHLRGRLPAPESVWTPTPRDQMLNASVRHQLQFADVWLSYGDFYLPRYIEPYIKASERWLAREVQAMRHSPAWDGLI